MKRYPALFLLFSLLQTHVTQAQSVRGDRATATPEPTRVPSSAPARANPFAPKSEGERPAANSGHSAVINMNPPANGPNNTVSVYYPPAYGQLQWINQSAPAPDNSAPPQANVPPPENVPTPVADAPTPTPAESAKVVHHHPYTPGYVRKKLQKIGVKTAPSYIANRREIMATDRKHSTVRLPKKGPDGKVLTVKAESPRHFNDDDIHVFMSKVNSPALLKKLMAMSATETKAKTSYWHKLDDLSFCHSVDPWGYHWYGWYQGDDLVWMRYFSGRWWFYDNDYDRWCFWHDGFWWWQDPHHVGDLYCYTPEEYIPCNSANDTIRVTNEDQPGATQYLSADKGRMVKVTGQAQDAFLYDNSADPSFGPVYLASGVKGVEFSSGASGKDLQIVLKLNDGSFDMLDGDGNPYNSGVTDAGPAVPTKAGQ